MKIVSFNVLFPPRNFYHKLFDDAQARYEYQLERLFTDEAAEVVCLQEVTEEYIPVLENSKFFKSGYKHSTPELTAVQAHFPMIVSNQPFVELYVKDKIVICLFNLSDTNLIVVNTHLYHVETANDRREEQLDHIQELLTNYEDLTTDKTVRERVKDALGKKNVIISGDFNMHYPGENQAIEKHGYTDLWLQKHSHFSGLTSDSTVNKLRYMMMPMDDRKMRLDRIIMKQSEDIDLDQIEMIGQEPIKNFYQFPSDHFGLSATF